MSKRFIIVVLLFFLSVFTLGADFLDFGAGPFIQYTKNPFSPETTYVDWIDSRNYLRGYDIRTRIGWAEFDTQVLIVQGNIIDVGEDHKPVYEDDISQKIYGTSSIGFSTEVAAFTKLGIFLGFPMGYSIGSTSSHFWMGTQDNVYSESDILEFIKDITFSYRMKLDVRIGHFILSLAYQVPSSGFSMRNFNQYSLIPDWDNQKIGFSLVSLFL